MGPAFKLLNFSQQAFSIVQSTASCSTTFRPGLPFPLLHYYHNTISIAPALQAATQLGPSCSLRLACCRTAAAAVLVAPSQPNAYYWWRRWYARLPQRLGEWPSASGTFDAITTLLTATRRVVARSLDFIFSRQVHIMMHAPLTS